MSGFGKENARLKNELAKRDRAEKEQLQAKLAKTKKAKKDLKQEVTRKTKELAIMRADVAWKDDMLNLANESLDAANRMLDAACAKAARKDAMLAVVRTEAASKTEELADARTEAARKDEALKAAQESYQLVIAELRQQLATKDVAIERKNTEIANIRGDLRQVQERIVGFASGHDNIMAPTISKRSIEMVSGRQDYVSDTISELTVGGSYSVVSERSTASPIDIRNVVREKAAALLKRKCEENPTAHKRITRAGADDLVCLSSSHR